MDLGRGRLGIILDLLVAMPSWVEVVEKLEREFVRDLFVGAGRASSAKFGVARLGLPSNDSYVDLQRRLSP